jgi:ATP-binding cassette, subfamily B, bacterial
MKTFPHYTQADFKDCGPTCIKIIAKFYNKNINIQTLRDVSETTRNGSNLLSLSDGAEKIGFRTLGVRFSYEKLLDTSFPCILHWNKGHYVVLYKIKKNKIFISDPAIGLLTYTKEEFLKFWIGNNASETSEEGIALLFEPTPRFFESDDNKNEKKGIGFGLLFQYALRYKSSLIQLSIGLFIGSLLQIIAPFLTQSVVDFGIQNKNLNFVYLILFAQIFIFIGSTAIGIIRSWILLHMSTRISISLISDFFIKLMNLPISFFDVRLTGDIMQRINDHHRIQAIMTTSSLNVLFSIINMFIMGGILAYYNLQIFSIYFIGSILYFLWITLFLKQREILDYKRFSEVSQEQSKVIELINGMQEIKLHNAEKQKRWGWEYVQARLFKVSMKGLVLGQIQGVGSSVINQLKNIFITIFAARLVIDGDITLGMMMAISGIIGSLDGPIGLLIGFVHEVQDAKISLARLSEIHDKQDEVQQEINQSSIFPKDCDIEIKDLSFRYIGSDIPILENLNLTIPAHKVTAIVGSSGSGKTTLMKLLLKFYDPINGEIFLKNKSNEIDSAFEITDLKNIAQKTWRTNIGAVMQEGYIFNDTIAANIAIGVDYIDYNRLMYAADVANIKSFISSLPLKYNTKIGMEGVGMSTGQKQRLLIARAVYKDPEMLFFDEATSALDSSNEKEILGKLEMFFKNKTVVVIAHRLSTVMNADQIVVLDKGKIIEIGSHHELVALKGFYYELVRSQLQLAS